MRLVDAVHHLFGDRLGGESIDHLPHARTAKGQAKADYLLFDRNVVVEVKEIVDERIEPVRKVIDRWRGRPGWPRIAGDPWLQDVLKLHPKGDEINAEITTAVRQTIENVVRDANRQIRETRARMALPNATGLLALANQNSDPLDPRALCATLAELLNKRTQAGTPRFPDVDIVILFCGAHEIIEADGKKNDVIVSVTRPSANGTSNQAPLATRVMTAWSELLGMPLINRGVISAARDFEALRFDGMKPPAVI